MKKLYTFSCFCITALFIGFSAVASDLASPQPKRLDPLSILPENEFIQCLDFLDGDDFRNAKSTCRAWHRLSEDHSLVLTAETFENKVRKLPASQLYRMARRSKAGIAFLEEFCRNYLENQRILFFDWDVYSYKHTQKLNKLEPELQEEEISDYEVYERACDALEQIKPLSLAKVIGVDILELGLVRNELSKLSNDQLQRLKHLYMAAKMIERALSRNENKDTSKLLASIRHEISSNHSRFFVLKGGFNAIEQNEVKVFIFHLQSAINQIDLVLNTENPVSQSALDTKKKLNGYLSMSYYKLAQRYQDRNQIIEALYQSSKCLEANISTQDDSEALADSYYRLGSAHIYKAADLISAYLEKPGDIEVTHRESILHLEEAERYAEKIIKIPEHKITKSDLEYITVLYRSSTEKYLTLALRVSDNTKQKRDFSLKALRCMENLFETPWFIPKDEDQKRLAHTQRNLATYQNLNSD